MDGSDCPPTDGSVAERSDAGRAAPRLHSRDFTDCDQLSGFTPACRTVFIQLSPGNFHGTIKRLDLEGVSLSHTTCSGDTLCRASVYPEMCHAIIPLQRGGIHCWNGWEITRPVIINPGMDREYVLTGHDMQSFNITFDPAAFQVAARSWTGRHGDDWERFWTGPQVLVPLPPESLANLYQLLELMSGSPEMVVAKEAGDMIESCLACILMHSMEEGGSLGKPVTRTFLTHARVIHRADEFLHDHGDRPVHLMEVCAAVGVSARCLEYAFKEICGVTPMRYLKARRLRLARRLLRDGTPSGMSVKQAALESGFVQMGRFSTEYRNFFGEKPSETLCRNARPA
jgi:AraC family ethanolamine operon transcriptional activator